MKQALKNVATYIAVIALVVVGAYISVTYFGSTETYINTATSTPEIIYRDVETERYDKLVEQILSEETEYWQNKARLSAERQASEELAEDYAARANEKKIEEQSL